MPTVTSSNEQSSGTGTPHQFDLQNEFKMRVAQAYALLMPYMLSVFQYAQERCMLWVEYLSNIFFTKEKNIKDEIVLITGSGGCLGRNLAFEMSKREVTLVLWDINEAANRKTEEMLRTYGHTGRIHTYTVDLSNEGQLREVAAKVREEVGFVSMVMMVAGAPFQPKTVLEVTNEQIQTQFVLSYMSQTWLIQEFVKPMVAHNKGHFVTISSSSAIVDVPLISAYASFKTAQAKQVETLREELLADGISGVKTTVVFMNILDGGLASGFGDAYIFDKDILISGEAAASQITSGVLKNRNVLFIDGVLRFVMCFKYLITPRINATLFTYKAKVSRKYLNFK